MQNLAAQPAHKVLDVGRRVPEVGGFEKLLSVCTLEPERIGPFGDRFKRWLTATLEDVLEAALLDADDASKLALRHAA